MMRSTIVSICGATHDRIDGALLYAVPPSLSRDEPDRRDHRQRQGAEGGDCAQDTSPRRRRVPGRSTDGRDQSRRATRLLCQLALFDLGQPVLSRRRPGRDGEGRSRRQFRPRAGPGVPCRVPERVPNAPDPSRRRRLFVGLLLLSVGVSLQTAEWTEIGLWAVVASGVYHAASTPGWTGRWRTPPG